MVSYVVKECTDCGVIFDAIGRIDKILAKYGKNQYLNISYLLRKPFSRSKIKLLIRYKVILEDCSWDFKFYEPYFSVQQIISRVKVLTNGLQY